MKSGQINIPFYPHDPGMPAPVKFAGPGNPTVSQFHLNPSEFHRIAEVLFFPERVGKDNDRSETFGSHDI